MIRTAVVNPKFFTFERKGGLQSLLPLPNFGPVTVDYEIRSMNVIISKTKGCKCSGNKI